MLVLFVQEMHFKNHWVKITDPCFLPYAAKHSLMDKAMHFTVKIRTLCLILSSLFSTQTTYPKMLFILLSKYFPYLQASHHGDHRFLFYFFFYFYFFISWRLITLQYCSGFCHTLKWISHGFTCVPHPTPPSHLPLHPIPLGLPSAPGLSTCLMHSFLVQAIIIPPLG